jgi:hypothetical protein
VKDRRLGSGKGRFPFRKNDTDVPLGEFGEVLGVGRVHRRFCWVQWREEGGFSDAPMRLDRSLLARPPCRPFVDSIAERGSRLEPQSALFAFKTRSASDSRNKYTPF